LNPELVRQALEKIPNPNILVNLISRRVRQLNSGGRPLITDTGTLGAADIALNEFVRDKMSWEAIIDLPSNETYAAKRRRRG
jgi:DNA-directed RNA polymerase subunit omega